MVGTQGLISEKRNVVRNAKPVSWVDPIRSGRWQGHGFLSFESAFTLACDAYADTLEDVVPSDTVCLIPVLVENE